MQLRQTGRNQDDTVHQHQDAAEEPNRYFSFFTHSYSLSLRYQKIKFNTKNTVITTQAQNSGFCHILVAPSSGIGVAP